MLQLGELIVLQVPQGIAAQDEELEPLVAREGVGLEVRQVVVGEVDLDEYAHVLERVAVDLVYAGVAQEDPLQIEQAHVLEDLGLEGGYLVAGQIEDLHVRVEARREGGEAGIVAES